MKRTISRAVPAALMLTLALGACGASNEGGSGDASGDAVSGTINGAGASSQDAAINAWKVGFEDANPDATVNYDPAGSGAGREQFLAGGLQYAGSDAYLDEDEIGKVPEKCGELIQFPAYISPIAVAYNLEGVDELNLSPKTLAGIFDQKIKKWNDDAVKADNPGVDLPDTAIRPVNRSDKSGTTENFLDYLAKTAPDDWKYEVDGNWPVAGGTAGKGTQGVVQAISVTDGTIGYADASQVGDLKSAKLKVGDEWVAPSAEGAAAVVDASTKPEGKVGEGEYNFAIDLKRDGTEAGTYPASLVAFTLACSTYDSEEQAKAVKAWLTHMLSEDGQKASAESAGSAPISSSARDTYMKAVDAISAK